MTPEPFFITGYPRSRTAWMAAFLTDGDVFCHHELTKYCQTREEFYSEMETGVGNSDSGLVFTDFQERFPKAKTVIIVRPYADMKASMERLMGRPMDFGDASIDHIKGLRVAYSRLDQSMPKICEYLGIPYNQKRHGMFQALKIETTDIEPPANFMDIWR